MQKRLDDLFSRTPLWVGWLLAAVSAGAIFALLQLDTARNCHEHAVVQYGKDTCPKTLWSRFL
ncbi:hypothetical protein [Ralstonia holmesii]|uniref:hypothetical protein n=1 Tax=Ralstonia holmesii TaxID=3058602 RepID=UPI003D649A03